MNNKPLKIASLIIIIILLSTSLVGCWDKRELEDQAFVMSLAVDKGSKPGTFLWSFRITSPRQLAGGQNSAGGNQPPSSLVSVESPSIFGALNLLNAFINRKANLMHTKALIVSEELAIIDPLPLRTLSRFREIRNNVYILVAEGKAKDIQEKNKPVLEKNPLKYAETLIQNSSFTGFTPKTQLLDFLVNLESKSTNPIAILIGINKGMDTTTVNPKNTSPYLPGEIPREGDTPIEIIGTAVFKGNHLVGKLNGSENRIMSELNGNFNSGYFTITDPLEPSRTIALDLRSGSPPVIKVKLRDTRPLISVTLSFEADILEIQGTTDYSNLSNMKKLENLIAAHITKNINALIKKTQLWGTDICGFGNKARHLVGTWSEWEQLNWPELYPIADVEVKVNFAIRRIGLQYQPVPHKD